MNALHSSKSSSWYTPSDIVEAARRVLGSIDLDPASCAEANEVVQATSFLTEVDDGLVAPWPGRNVFLNPPGGRGVPRAFWQRLMRHRNAGLLDHAIFVCFSLEQLVSFQSEHVHPLDFSVCIPSSRVRYRLPGGGKASSPTHGSAIVYVNGTRNEHELFLAVFGAFGAVK